MWITARQIPFVALSLLGLVGCGGSPEPPSAADLMLNFARCWPHEVLNRDEGLVRLEVLGVYMPDQGAMILSGECPQGADLRWHIRDYETDVTLKKFAGLLSADRPTFVGFQANVVGTFKIGTGHLGGPVLTFEVTSWKFLEPVSPELSDRLGGRFDKGEGPI